MLVLKKIWCLKKELRLNFPPLCSRQSLLQTWGRDSDLIPFETLDKRCLCRTLASADLWRSSRASKQSPSLVVLLLQGQVGGVTTSPNSSCSGEAMAMEPIYSLKDWTKHKSFCPLSLWEPKWGRGMQILSASSLHFVERLFFVSQRSFSHQGEFVD